MVDLICFEFENAHIRNTVILNVTDIWSFCLQSGFKYEVEN